MFYNVDMIVGKNKEDALKNAFLSDINLRWLVAGISLPLAALYIYFNREVNYAPFIILSAAIAAVNGIYIFIYKKKEEYIGKALIVSGLVDIAAVTAAVYITGGMASPLFLIYYFIILDGCFDYWSGRYFYLFTAFALACYAVVYLTEAGGALMSPELPLFLLRAFFLLAVGFLGYSVSKGMRKQYLKTERVNVEKEILYDKLKEINIGLERKVKKSTENLEKANLTLVKKNISLLAAHEIYKTANEAKTRKELLDMILGIVFPLMKGNGGVIFSLSENKKKVTVKSFKMLMGSCDIKEGDSYPVNRDSEFYEMTVKKRARLFEKLEGAAKDPFFTEVIKTGSVITAPLLSGGEPSGFILVFNRNPFVYNKNDAELIELLGEQIGTLLFNREIYEEMKAKASGLEKLMQLTVDIEASLERDEIIKTALSESIKRIFKHSSGVVIMLDTSNELKVKSQYGYADDLIDSVVPSSSIPGWACKNNRGLTVKEAAKMKIYNPESDSRYMKEAALVVPIPSKGEIIGAFCLSRNDGYYTREDLYFLTILSNYVGGAIETAKLYENIKRDYINTIYSLAAAVDAKDHYTHGHSTTVMKYSIKMAERLGIKGEEAETIKYAALLHDIGKIGISENIINKPGKLSNEEYAIIKMHPQLGANIISKIDSLKKLVPLVLSHHEWLNGSGYPLGLRGEEIPFGARIISAADAYSTMTSKRPYRDERSMEFAIGELKKCSGEQFDPVVVDTFLKILEEEKREMRRQKEAKGKPSAGKSGKKRLRIQVDDEGKHRGITHEEGDFYS